VWVHKPYRLRVESDCWWNEDFYLEVGDRAWRPGLTYHRYGSEETESSGLLPVSRPWG
jgi:hypothetical protein